MFVGDVGQSSREEIDVQQPTNPGGGENYGWRVREGSVQNPAYPGTTTPPGAIDPIFDYPRSVGRTVIGGYIYRGQQIPNLRGLYVFADYLGPDSTPSTGQVFTLNYNGTIASNFQNITAQLFPTCVGGFTLSNPSSLGEDANGELYITDIGNGSVFKIVASAVRSDFNGDGKPDYVLYNASTRRTAVWYLNNNVFLSSAYGPTLPAGWTLVDAADFNRNGETDYALFNPSTRQTAIWYLSGVAFRGGAFGPTLPSGWALVAVGDFNGDGKPDYVLYNASTHQTAVWYMNNNVFAGGVSVRLFRLAGAWRVWRISMAMENLITYSSMRARVSLRSGICLGLHLSEAPLGQPCQRLGIDRNGRFQWGRRPDYRALQSQHGPNGDLVHEQQRAS